MYASLFARLLALSLVALLSLPSQVGAQAAPPGPPPPQHVSGPPPVSPSGPPPPPRLSAPPPPSPAAGPASAPSNPPSGTRQPAPPPPTGGLPPNIPSGQPQPGGQAGPPPACPFPCGAPAGAQPPQPMPDGPAPACPFPCGAPAGAQPPQPMPDGPPPACPFPCGAPAGAQPPQGFGLATPRLTGDPEWIRIQAQLANSTNFHDRANAAVSALQLLQQRGLSDQGSDVLASIDGEVHERLQQLSQQAADPQADQAVVQQQLEELNGLQRQVDAIRLDMHNSSSSTNQNLHVMDGTGTDPMNGNGAIAQSGPVPGVGQPPEPAALPTEAAGA
jgi:hypothetical protein